MSYTAWESIDGALVPITIRGLAALVEVKLWWSGDDALVWGSNTLDRQADGMWGAVVPITYSDTLLSYVDVEYSTGELLGAQHFTLSSRPSLPANHVPRIRTVSTCLPL